MLFNMCPKFKSKKMKGCIHRFISFVILHQLFVIVVNVIRGRALMVFEKKGLSDLTGYREENGWQ